MYKKELLALEKAGRLRKRTLFSSSLYDFASNDYLGLGTKKKLQRHAFHLLQSYNVTAPKASQLVNGYHPLHALFEEEIAQRYGYQRGIVLGSGFLANLALFEALIRKNDTLIVDEEYHASGMLATKLSQGEVRFFRHNDPEDLRQELLQAKGRVFVAVEGVYSMSGTIVHPDLIPLCHEFGAYVILDEAHSSGVLGKSLKGIQEYYSYQENTFIIKMGTLGKAYGAYGAYILACDPILSFLENRAKPLIYSTAPSLYETALSLISGRYIDKNSVKLSQKLTKRLLIANEFLETPVNTPIIAYPMPNNQTLLIRHEQLQKANFLVGAIRPPTVRHPQLRIITHLGNSCKTTRFLFETLHKLSQ